MLNVFITIDTEVSPRSSEWRREGMERNIDRDIYGIIEAGEFGVRYQMDVLDRHGLKAIFFVETLFALVIGLEPLRDLVQLIQGRGHEVQLHLHTEWLAALDSSPLPGRAGENLRDFTVDEQTRLISIGLENLRACDAKSICAFRAGNYGANFDTLHALARNSIRYDTSYDVAYLDSDCGMKEALLLLQPTMINGVYEFPISFFTDWPGHYRHAQLCACSSNEMKHALMQAWKENWFSFVLVSHSFELIRDRKHPKRSARPDRKVIERFEKMCAFLAKNTDKFQTRGFFEIDEKSIPSAREFNPLRSRIHRTAGRFGEQLLRRF